MTQSNPTPTSHGAWRVINGKLVNEEVQPVAPATDATPPAAVNKAAGTLRKTSTRD